MNGGCYAAAVHERAANSVAPSPVYGGGMGRGHASTNLFAAPSLTLPRKRGREDTEIADPSLSLPGKRGGDIQSVSLSRLYRKSQWLAPRMMVCVRVSFMSGSNPSAMVKSALQTSRNPSSGSPSSL
jgi:hypothetical protein